MSTESEPESGGRTARRSFVESLWDLDEQTLIQRFITARRASDQETALAILQAKALVASQQTARSTQHLAWATFVLALLTFVLVLVTVFHG